MNITQEILSEITTYMKYAKFKPEVNRRETWEELVTRNKEMPIYDFEKLLRKDYRWQYTDNARRDVSNVALKVLRDFGFQA